MDTFCFIDRLGELKKGESLAASFTLKGSEEFLKDHFENFPVMPGVLVLESLKQTAMALLELSALSEKRLLSMVEVGRARFGQFVRPGNRLELFVRLDSKEKGLFYFEGRAEFADAAAGEKAPLVADFSLASRIN